MSGIIAQNSGRHTGLIKAASAAGVWNLIKTYTASSDSTLSFVEGTDGVDFTAYDEFVFKFFDIHPATNDVNFEFNMSTDGGSNYNVTKTTTFFNGFHTEADGGEEVTYITSRDLAQSTSNASITREIGNLNDESTSGNLFLFSPSSTTFVKHFISRFQDYSHADAAFDSFSAGYGNTTSAVDAIQFSMSSGNIDAGQISLFGIS